ncbi:VIT domain-containing protein [Desulfococcaceae bacterium HSG7]|nr:VIT domain-containing protein [Desulfococcaceae bacterium HSG7]
MAEETQSAKDKSSELPKESEAKHPKGLISILLFGIILPTGAAIFELFTHICAETFFNPLPTFWHILIFSLIPVGNFICWIAILRDNTTYLSKLGLANGIALGVSLAYTVLFLPLLPVSLIGILFVGIGLCGLAPICSFISAISCRRHLNNISQVAKKRKNSGLGQGTTIGLGMLLILHISPILTHLSINMAVSDDPKYEINGIRFLRWLGDEDTMLEMCYVFGRNPFFARITNVDFKEARKLYYRTTGTPFNTFPSPSPSGDRLYFRRPRFDEGIGGEAVSGKVEGLSLKDSRMDAVIHPDAALSYLEWILVFRNRSRRQQEARAQILLPPGGVVSRLTLWIDGEEREAAFSTRGKVRQAYTRVVRRRRDPVLVTTKGTDRVLAQCFPVPPGGEMKIRLGITSPLHLKSREQGILLLPCLSEYNFSIPKGIRHSIWAESKKPLSTTIDTFKAEQIEEGLYAVRGTMDDSDFAVTRIAIQAARSDDAVMAWTSDSFSKNGQIIRQVIEETEVPIPSRIVVVIDGSRGMKKSIPAIAEAFAYLPEQVEFGLVLASDTTQKLVIPVQKGSKEIYQTAMNIIRESDYEGGQNNVSALALAWEIAAEKSGSAIVWIHGNQPILLQSTEILQQKWDRRPGRVGLFDIQVTNGPNRIIEKLRAPGAVELVPFTDSNVSDLKNLFAAWNGKRRYFTISRERTAAISYSEQTKESSSHLARLWAYNEILRLYPSKAKIDQAIQLAVNYQLVTPISGAVVLETERQYKEAGLEPGNPSDVPQISSIPEPATLWLMAIGIIIMLGISYKKRKKFHIPKNS